MRPKLSYFLSAALISAPALANDSVYTDVSRDKCRLLREWEGASSQSLCPGIGDYPVHFIESDIRQSFFFGHVRQSYLENGFESFGPFNHAETTVEWRLEKLPNGKTRPFATILRWNVRTEADVERGDNKSTGQTLVVTRLNPGGVCHVGYVDARAPGANEAARKLADEKARSFRCGEDKAE